MHIARRDVVARGVFAAAIIAAHLLIGYFLAAPWIRDTAPVSGVGESVLFLMPGTAREVEEQAGPPRLLEPQFEPPEVVWADPAASDLDIRLPADDPRQLAFAQRGSGRPDVRQTDEPDAGIAVLKRVLPQYPVESVRANEEGSTVLQVRVDEGGRASEVRVARSSGHARLDDSAVTAVKAWKFAPSTNGALPESTWGEMELRFELYHFTVSRIVDAPLDLVPPGQILNASRVAPVPGGEVALYLLMDEVRAANADAFDAPWLRNELQRMKEALAGWGDVDEVRYKGSAAGNRWRSYEIRPEFRKGVERETVELRWDVYEVAHNHGTSEWRIALDRNGNIWCAHAGSVRPGTIVLQVAR